MNEVVLRAFSDELTKIAKTPLGRLAGYVDDSFPYAKDLHEAHGKLSDLRAPEEEEEEPVITVKTPAVAPPVLRNKDLKAYERANNLPWNPSSPK